MTFSMYLPRIKKTFILFDLLCYEACHISAMSLISFLSISSTFVRVPAEMGGKRLLSTLLFPWSVSVAIKTIGDTLHCTAVLLCTALHFSALHCTALHCTALHCTNLHCNTLNYAALYCTAIHYSVEVNLVLPQA